MLGYLLTHTWHRFTTVTAWTKQSPYSLNSIGSVSIPSKHVDLGLVYAQRGGMTAARSTSSRRQQLPAPALAAPAASVQQQAQLPAAPPTEHSSHGLASPQNITIVPVVSAGASAAAAAAGLASRDAAGHLPVSISIGLPAALAKELASPGADIPFSACM